MITSSLNRRVVAQDSPAKHSNAAKAQACSTLDAASAACRRIAPLWPLQHFVAVNPFLGLSSRSFTEAAQILAQAAGARMTLPRAAYAEALASGRITNADLATALVRAESSTSRAISVDDLKAALINSTKQALSPLGSVADAASVQGANDWSAFVTERISSWAASHFDEGQAAWASPWRGLSPFAAWREHAMIDRTPELMGLAGFRDTVRALPDRAEAMLVVGIARLDLDDADQTSYFHRLLMSIGGWAGYARHQVWNSELRGETDTTLIELLAIRLAWEVALHKAMSADIGMTRAWQRSRQILSTHAPVEPSFAIDELLQVAYENAWQREFLAKLSTPREHVSESRKTVQAAFCIDVRSEVYRRALESTSAQIDTLGFAGFFGFAIEFVPLGQAHGYAQCPVLLRPAFRVCETVKYASASEHLRIVQKRGLRQRTAQAWRSFKLAAVASFAFVETMGWSYARNLVSDGFGLTRVVAQPASAGLSASEQAQLGPDITATQVDGRVSGFNAQQRVEMAASVLKAMSLRNEFARVVLLVGHAASTVNNPHSSGLDCGACGGHSGEANARVAVSILNDVDVRAGLLAHQIEVPQDTIFVAGLHDTTSDDVTLFDLDAVPPSHAEDLAQLQVWLSQASRSARAERAHHLHLDAGRAIDAQVIARSLDWSQTRPEWGLASCAAFIAAPRSATQDLDFAGRAFLHSYDWRQDENESVLELIMTAPMVVASWISLQYYGSTVDNRVFGCGNKVLHNVVGTLGVLEGNGGDLRSGLPWQSVHDGERLMHEPMRLSVVIAAPIEAINRVIARHESVRELVDNGWLHLFALDDESRKIQRYRRTLLWEASEAHARVNGQAASI